MDAIYRLSYEKYLFMLLQWVLLSDKVTVSPYNGIISHTIWNFNIRVIKLLVRPAVGQ